MEKFKDVLKESNLKATHQRLAILKYIESYGHIDIDTLFNAIICQYPTLSKATLYRNINNLLSFHILEEVKFPHQKQHYEIKKIPHIHLLCIRCGSVKDIFIDTKLLLKSISVQSDFTINSSFIVMNGLCKECQTY